MVKSLSEISIPVEKVFWALFSFLVVYIVYASYSMRIFYPDGTIFFVHLLEHATPVHWHWDRQFAYYVQHFPLISAIKSGITDIPTLARIHTAWYFSFGALSLLASYLSLPKEKKIFILFPLFWMFGIYMQTEFFPITPGRMLSAIFWVVTIQLIFRSSWKSLFLIVLVSWCTLRIYQGMMILGPVLALLSYWRFSQFEQKGKALPIAYILLGLYYLSGAFLSFLSVLDPQDKTSFLTFIFGLFLFIDEEGYPSFPLLFGLLGSLFFLFRVYKNRKTDKSFFPKTIIGLLTVLGVLTFISPLFWPEAMAPETHQQVRSINIYLCVILAAFLFLTATKKLRLNTEWKTNAIPFVLILGLLQVYWNMMATYQWNNYLDIFTETLSEAPDGLILAQDTKLLDLNNEYGLSNGFHNDWDTPLMSILFAPDGGEIETIMAHSYDNIYHPVDPRDTDQLPNLEKYNVDYSRYLLALSKQDSISIPDRPLPEILKWIETNTTGVNDFFDED
ncbi:MAG: hypothetical protein RLN81_04460 [Balneolaceae bacterium]